jgi:hypothetical protein
LPSDESLDLALLKVEGVNRPALPLSAGRDLSIAEKVYAAGNPKGLEGTFSDGIVSGVRQSDHLIQHTAPISHGSSGGPLVDEYGKVIGINTLAISEGQNLNFAIPALYLKKFLEEVRTQNVLARNQLGASERPVAEVEGSRPETAAPAAPKAGDSNESAVSVFKKWKGDQYVSPKPGDSNETAIAPPPDPKVLAPNAREQAEREFFMRAMRSGEAEDFDVYLEKFPNGKSASDAKLRATEGIRIREELKAVAYQFIEALKNVDKATLDLLLSDQYYSSIRKMDTLKSFNKKEMLALIGRDIKIKSYQIEIINLDFINGKWNLEYNVKLEFRNKPISVFRHKMIFSKQIGQWKIVRFDFDPA